MNPPLSAGATSRARRTSPAARSLALGFGGAVAMWAVAYIALMSPGLIVGEALFVLTLACITVTGYLAGLQRVSGESAAIAAIKAGVVIACVNMLLIGSLVGGETSGDRLAQLPLWTAGNFAVTLVLAAIGGALASMRIVADDSTPSQRDWFSLFTRIAAITVFLLLITGGLVTGLEAGLAVPDWPNSFGHNMLLYPLSEMKGGIYYEHAHRLYGMLVGVTAITLAIGAFVFDERKWLRVLAVIYLLMVCTQGYMGGRRVTEISDLLAIAHGVFGQITFATICAIAAFSSSHWRWERARCDAPDASTDRLWSTLLVGAFIVQLVLGAMYRHTLHMHVLYTHILWAAFVLGLVIFVGGRAWRGHSAAREDDQRLLGTLGKSMLHATMLQVVLGIIAMIAVWSRPSAPPKVLGEATPIEVIPLWETIFTTAHQATGALLFALATLVMVWTRRVLPGK